MIQRIVLYATLGTLLDALGQDWTGWGFWCVLGLFWAVDTLSRREGWEQGVWDAINMPERDINNIKKLIKEDEDES